MNQGLFQIFPSNILHEYKNICYIRLFVCLDAQDNWKQHKRTSMVSLLFARFYARHEMCWELRSLESFVSKFLGIFFQTLSCWGNTQAVPTYSLTVQISHCQHRIYPVVVFNTEVNLSHWSINHSTKYCTSVVLFLIEKYEEEKKAKQWQAVIHSIMHDTVGKMSAYGYFG